MSDHPDQQPAPDPIPQHRVRSGDGNIGLGDVGGEVQVEGIMDGRVVLLHLVHDNDVGVGTVRYEPGGAVGLG